ncbi:DUF3883 domain-containing protein [Sphingobacterium luzhongxinii]|uniref:DUF3883 domain-containing protein n=1 Tax=Sphingobacterium luzhongxinii TaxID=2654181 RepID=UPI0013DD7E6B|nr:DUF3883 domain-containing protein [Sphingobacterium sp. xlx-73]
MDSNRKLAHIVAYYLSKFDKVALNKLGYKTDKEAFNKTAEALNILPNYIKFRRDEFDVVHPHRKGWHKRAMSIGVLNTINALADLDESAVYELVKDILSKSHQSEDPEMKQLENIVSDGDTKTKRDTVYVPRGITGRAAEEYFIDQFKAGNFAFQGQLKDCRDLGVGYDFLIESNTKTIYVEVKGRDGNVGGLLFTNKEWEVAKRLGESYYLCLISDVADAPQIQILQNPAAHIEAEKYVYTTIQVSWTVSQKIINEAFR